MRYFLLLFFVTTLTWSQTYRFAVFPSNDISKLTVAFSPLINFLEQQTGHSFELIITKDYTELLQRIREESVDFAWINSRGFAAICDTLCDAQYLVTYVEYDEASGKEEPFYQSVIVTRADSSLTLLSDLKGKRFAFTDRGSTSGYAVPRLMLYQEGIDPETTFSHTFFLKKHDKVILALKEASIDAGAISDGTYENAQKTYPNIFRILKRSDPIPLDAIVARKNMDEQMAESIRALLLSLKRTDLPMQGIKKSLNWNAAGFQDKGSSFYDTIRDLVRLGL